MESTIAQAMEQEKKRILAEAAQALKVLRESGNTAVVEAEKKLADVVQGWERSVAALEKFSLTSVADILLKGGVVIGTRMRWPREYRGSITFERVMDESRSYGINPFYGMQLNLPPKLNPEEAEVELFIVAVPVKKESK